MLCAELDNGTIIKGETEIDIPHHDGSLRIKKIYLDPAAHMYREAYDAIARADMIVIGPGDLYTSILPNILVHGFREAIKKSNAKIVYIVNIMTKWGETNEFRASDFAKTLLSYLKLKKIDYIVVNNSKIKQSLIKKYEGEKSFPVKIDASKLTLYADTIITADTALQTDIVRHDSEKISRILMKILEA